MTKFINRSVGKTNKGNASRYFILCFGISWTAAFLLIASRLWRGEHLNKFDGILMFSLMLLGPPFACIILTLIENGRVGWTNLRSRLSFHGWKNRFWLCLLLMPPVLIGMVLSAFSKLSGPVYLPNFFPAGFIFGLTAGFLDEIGWMGFAFPALRFKYSFLSASLLLGFLWGCWHLPVIDFLGSATQHGNWLPVFFIVFVFIMMAVRVLICMVYSKTGSIYTCHAFACKLHRLPGYAKPTACFGRSGNHLVCCIWNPAMALRFPDL